MLYRKAVKHPQISGEVAQGGCYVCNCCGDVIFEGEEYYDFRWIDSGIGILCKDCVRYSHRYDAEQEVI